MEARRIHTTPLMPDRLSGRVRPTHAAVTRQGRKSSLTPSQLICKIPNSLIITVHD